MSRCPCWCHQEARGNYEEARQHDRWFETMTASNSPLVNVIEPVDDDDVIEAAVAQGCVCLDYHCPALLDPVQRLMPREKWEEKYPKAQADGIPGVEPDDDPPEGQEA
jgi:hypothetical protein